MSLWAKLGAIGLGVAGVATGNPALIGAGASVLGADINAEGVKKASDQQVKAAEQAKAEADARYDAARNEARGIYQTNAAAFSPYQQLGAGASGNLAGLVGLPPLQLSNPALQQTQPVGTPAQMSAAVPTQPAPMLAGGAQPVTRAEERDAYGQGLLGKRGERGAPLAALNGGVVLLQSPDGREQQWVKKSAAAGLLARGAREVQ